MKSFLCSFKPLCFYKWITSELLCVIRRQQLSSLGFVDNQIPPNTSWQGQGVTTFISVSSPLLCDVPGPRPSVGFCSGTGIFTSGSRPLSSEHQLIRECVKQARIIKLAVPAVSWGPWTRVRANMANCETLTVVHNLLIISGMKQGEELNGLKGKIKGCGRRYGLDVVQMFGHYGAYWQSRASQQLHHHLVPVSSFICFPPP